MLNGSLSLQKIKKLIKIMDDLSLLIAIEEKNKKNFIEERAFVDLSYDNYLRYLEFLKHKENGKENEQE